MVYSFKFLIPENEEVDWLVLPFSPAAQPYLGTLATKKLVQASKPIGNTWTKWFQSQLIFKQE